MFQDELHKTVVAGVMKQSSVDENACSDFDFENKKPINLMKNRRNDDDDNLTVTEKLIEHHNSNDQWSLREDEGKVPVPKPREKRQLPFEEKEVKNSIGDESPKPKPRYNFLKRESNHAWSNELEKQDDNLFNTRCSTSDSKLSRTVNVYKMDSGTFCPEMLEKQSITHKMLEELRRPCSVYKKEEKVQTGMKLMGIKSQNLETNGKSKSRRSLNSPVESLECSSIGKSPQSKTTEPQYLGTLKILDRKANETYNLEATDTIRASIYQEWLERKRQILSENKRHRKLKVQQENEKREQKNIANKKEAKASFEAWKTRKKNAFKETYQKKKEEEKIKQQAEAEKEERKEEAKKVFEKWKEGKERYLQENLQKQKQVKKEKKEKEKEQINERKEGNASAFMKWNEEKEMMMKQRMIEITKVQQKKKREEEYTKCEREEMAALVYKKWLAEKEKNEKKQKQMKSVLCRDPLPPWSPPNKTIPFGK
ncbi:uncharacterized protein [Mobula birostris]|uniref:uncharacterized protein isoform X3 n=1 Tax=Mobula birostris TaxID=1983395 RepID=UPI003B28D12E